jgi:hypothetical protein
MYYKMETVYVLFVGDILKSQPQRINRQSIGLERKTKESTEVISRKLTVQQTMRYPVEFSTGVN